MPLISATPKTREEIAAEHLLRGPAATFNHLFQDWKYKFELIWKNPNPQAVIDKLGNDAEELFALSAKLVYLLEDIKPGCCLPSLALMQTVEFDENGKGTIVPAE